MIVLNNKRLVLIIMCVFVSVFTFMLSNQNEESIIQTVNLPVSGKTIVIDARTSEFQMKVHKVVMVLLKRRLI